MRARAASAPLSSVMAVSVAVLTLWPTGGSAGAVSAPRPRALGTVVLPAIGFGYTVTSQGPLAASQFPTGSPSAAAATGALSTLGNTIETYQRSWQDAAAVNQVQDLVVRFPTGAAAGAFVGAARRAIAHGEIVSSGPLLSIPGAQRTTYFASTNRAGVGQTITMRRGNDAAVLSFVSAASGNPAPITRASAERVAEAQYTAMATAVAGPVGAKSADGGGVSAADMGWAVLGVAVLAAAVTIPLVRRRRRQESD